VIYTYTRKQNKHFGLFRFVWSLHDFVEGTIILTVYTVYLHWDNITHNY